MDHWIAWENYPCPLHPSWDLHAVSDLDLAKLKRSIDTDENTEMVIERLIYRAFLECPKQQGILYNQKPNRPSEALNLLREAEISVEKMCRSEDEQIGYGIVINTFRMWITTDPLQANDYLKKLITLSSKKEKYTKHEVYVNVVHAYILSRLGPRWSEKALSLYCDAVKHFPENYEWMLGKALIIGRKARGQMELRDWKYPLPKHINQQFQEEKTILEYILKLNHNYHHARALYGNVCFNLQHDRNSVEKEMLKALKGNEENPTICVLVAKFYKRNRNYPEAEKLLVRLVRSVHTAEVHCQLGCLYRAWAPFHSAKECFRLRKAALSYFKLAVDLDSCHYPSLCKKAEMEYELGFKKEARRLFMDLFDGTFKDKPHLVLEEYSCLKSAIWIDAFTPLQLLQLSHRFIELTVALPHMSSFTTEFNHSFVKIHIDRCLLLFKRYMHDRNEKNKWEAKLKWANANLLLEKDMEKTTKFHEDLIKECKGFKERKDLSFGLGKCYIIMGQQALDRGDEKEAIILWGYATKSADLLQQDNVERLANELYADIHLLKAKTLYNNLSKCENNLTKSENELKKAIEMGSLEASYIYISTRKNLAEHFFSEDNVHETLAGVQLACDNDSPLHKNFTVETSYDHEIIYDVSFKRRIIRKMLDDLINHKFSFEKDSEDGILSTLATQLEEIHQTRFEYEVELIKSKRNKEWGKAYKKQLLSLLGVTRNTMDNCVAVCQKWFLVQEEKQTSFPFFFDWTNVQVDPERCLGKVQKWAKNMFPEDTPLPDGLVKKIAEVQPMFDAKNMWLVALRKCTNLDKHAKVDLHLGEKFSLKLNRDMIHQTDTECIARKSSNEVVKLVKYLVQSLPSPPNTDERASLTETN